jgi:integrase
MTEAEIRAIEQLTVTPAQRLVVTLAAIHAARSEPIRHLRLEDLDLSNQRITIAGHTQRLGELTYQTLRAWLDQRRIAWPHTPNPHVLISQRTNLGVMPVSKGYLHFHLLRRGIDIERIRNDRVLHEALTVGPDPLHLALSSTCRTPPPAATQPSPSGCSMASPLSFT